MSVRGVPLILVHPDSPVLVLEDSDERIAWFRKHIPHVTIVSTAKDAISLLSCGVEYDAIFLDHDLGPLDFGGNPGPAGCGMDVARYLSSNPTDAQIVIHSWNPEAAIQMASMLDGAPVMPFGKFNVQLIGLP